MVHLTIPGYKYTSLKYAPSDFPCEYLPEVVWNSHLVKTPEDGI